MITGELRDAMKRWGWVAEDGMVTFGNCTPPSIDADPVLSIYGSDFDRMCDAIDAVHANLERENESLRRELDRVLGEQEEAPTSIGSATITVMPALDWSGIAADLRELAALCERTREEDE